MQHLTQARSKNKAAGEPIELPFTNMKQSGIFIRRGQLTLVAAGPGTGKSAFVQAICQRGNDHGVRNSVFYFSADSTPWDLFTRAAAIATDRPIDEIEQEIEQDGADRYSEIVNRATSNMMVDFRTDPDDEYVVEQLRAYADLNGRYPDVIVMDNLKNLDVGNGDDEFRALEEASVFLHEIAKTTNAAVIALHHVRGDMENGFDQIPLSGVRGKVSKTPAMVLTLWKRAIDGGNILFNVSVVKNRAGKVSAMGDYYISLRADLSRMSFIG